MKLFNLFSTNIEITLRCLRLTFSVPIHLNTSMFPVLSGQKRKGEKENGNST